MKHFIQAVFLITLSSHSFGQADVSYGMTRLENDEWLARVRTSDKDAQWSLVKDRLIVKRQPLTHASELVTPILVIDGILTPDSITETQKDFLVNTVTAEIVDIRVLEKEPEGLYVEKAFAGVVLLSITDKKASKKFRKLYKR